MKILFEATTASELKEVLAKANISVPARTEGRTTDHVERSDIANLLSAMMQAELITYPVTLTHRDRPDFLLSMGNRSIGIEHTEAIHQNEAYKDSLREEINGTRTWLISRVLPGEPKKKRKELIKEIEENNPGDGWDEDSPEIEWADAMLYSVRKKLTAISKAGFDRFDENWLLVYDNWSLPAPDIRKAAPLFLHVVKQSEALKEFDRIFVMRNKLFCDVSAMGVRLQTV